MKSLKRLMRTMRMKKAKVTIMNTNSLSQCPLISKFQDKITQSKSSNSL